MRESKGKHIYPILVNYEYMCIRYGVTQPRLIQPSHVILRSFNKLQMH